MAIFADLLSPPPTFVNVFPISLGKKCPVSHSSQWSVTCRVREKEAFRRTGNARFPRQGHTCGRSIWEDGQLPAAGQTPGELFRAGRCPASAMQPAGVVGSGRRDGTARAPRCKRKTVKALSPTLGIAGKAHSIARTCNGKPDPKGERPNNHSQKLLLSIP